MIAICFLCSIVVCILKIDLNEIPQNLMGLFFMRFYRYTTTHPGKMERKIIDDLNRPLQLSK